jgi:diguanylate cyclase (GGDEF)-like protein
MSSNVLLVDDNPAMIQVMARMLEGLGELRFATSGADALKKVRESPPDLMLLDAEMPGMSGFEVCEVMKSNRAMRDIPIIFVTSHGDSEFEALGLDAGAADYVTKPVNETALVARVKAQLRTKHQADALRDLGRVDALTEVANRRWFDETLEREWLRGLRPGEPISLLLFGVDHFQLFNARYGHPAGDACLQAVARVLKAGCRRPADLLARYRADEFVLLLPNTSRAGAQHQAHRMLRAIEKLAIAHATSPTCQHVTVSIGLSMFDEDSACWVQPSALGRMDVKPRCSSDDLARCAEQALQLAKQNGRAQAWTLDISDGDAPDRAEEISPSFRPSNFTPL